MKKRYYYIFGAICYVILSALNLLIANSNSKSAKVRSLYISLAYEKTYSGRVIRKNPIKGGGSLIDLNNGAKLVIGQTYNYAYDPPFLSTAIHLNDSIFKAENSNMLRVVKEDKVLEFNLKESINKELKR